MLRLSNIQGTHDVATDSLFQTNLLFGANTGSPWFAGQSDNPEGTPTTRADQAIDHFEISVIRYPGGGTDDAFSDGMIINGRLPEHVINILTYAKANAMTVNMVVPVDTPSGLSRSEFLSQMTQFAATVHQQFPGVVTGYELGNEYWGGRTPFDSSRELAYGTNAGETAVVLARGMDTAGYDANVFLQASGNLRGSFGNSSDLANGAIQQGFGSVPGAMNALDGIIRNNYWRADDTGGFANSTGLFEEDRGLEFNFGGEQHNWQAWIGRDLINIVGEYNINRNIGINDDGIDMGIHGASFLLEHMTNMIDAGVDKAFAWPLIHNTQNAFIFRNEAITTVSVHGMDIATNTTRAAMLDLMRQTLTSHELVDADWSFGQTANDVEVTLFRKVGEGAQNGHGENIVFLSSRKAEAMTFTADLSGFVSGYEAVRAVAISYEQDGSHQRDAIVREVAISDPEGDAIFDVTLQPYEVIQFIFVQRCATCTTDEGEPDLPSDLDPTGPSIAIEGVRFFGTDEMDRFFGLAGNDTVFAGGGNDIVLGGDGDDFIRGQGGDDRLFGLGGNDMLYGDVGNDTILAGSGSDQLFGGFGRDLLHAEDGDDTLHGGHGHDHLFGQEGHDVLFGDHGNDAIYGNGGNDTLDGGAGNDKLFGGSGSDVFRFTAGHGHDVIDDFGLRFGDRIDLSALNLQIAPQPFPFFIGQNLARQVDADVVITTSETSSITLKDTELFLLSWHNFIL